MSKPVKHDPFSRAKRRQEELQKQRKVGDNDSWSTKGSGGAVRCDRRREQAAKKARSSKYIEEALRLFDYNGSQGLNFAQLKDFLKHLDTRCDAAPDPTEAELKWIIQLSTPDRQAFDGEWVRGEMQLEGIGLETAAKCWLSYTETVAFIDPVFNEFDTDGTGNLSREKLSQVLSRLNDDLEPSADDLDFVMSKADVIGDGLIHKPEMVQAISIWYSIEDEDKVSYQHHHRRHGDREQEEQFHKAAQKFTKKTFKLLKKFDSEFQGGARRAIRRQEQARRVKESQQFIQDVLEKFDRDSSGGLKFTEIRNFLQNLDAARGIPPSDPEVKWIIQMCTPEVQLFNGEWLRGELQLEGDALHKAAACWLSYTQMAGEIERYCDELDPTSFTTDDAVDKLALESLLTRLNDGVAPLEADIDYVMQQADSMNDGVLHRPELVQAISLWYSLAGRDENLEGGQSGHAQSRKMPAAAAAAGAVQASSCCSLQ